MDAESIKAKALSYGDEEINGYTKIYLLFLSSQADGKQKSYLLRVSIFAARIKSLSVNPLILWV